MFVAWDKIKMNWERCNVLAIISIKFGFTIEINYNDLLRKKISMNYFNSALSIIVEWAIIVCTLYTSTEIKKSLKIISNYHSFMQK